MILQTINQNQAWIQMEWQCAFSMYWDNILHAAKTIMPTFSESEILIGDPCAGSKKIDPNTNPEEKSMLQIRGNSVILKGKIAITFYTNTNRLIINIPKSLCLACEYEALSKGVGPLMDSIELCMYKVR